MSGFRSSVTGLLQRFTRSQKGNVAMMAGIALPVLLMISAGAIDLHNAAKVKSELQDSLDAATLAVARSSSSDATVLQNIGMASMRANMTNYYQPGSKDVATFTLDSKYRVQSTATVQVKTIIANVFLPPYGQLFDDYLPMSANSQVLRASRNVEVAIALDVTGSMDGHMGALEDAAKELVGIVVQGDQALFTTKVALVPYAAGVNAGSLASDLRGPIETGNPAITAASWVGDQKSVSGINNSTKTFTLANHGLKKGDGILMTNFASNSNLNNKVWTVDTVGANTFTIKSPPSNIRTTLGRFRKCVDPSCNLVVTTSADHNLIEGEIVKVENTRGISNFNGYHEIALHKPDGVVDTKRFVVPISVTTVLSDLEPTLSGQNRRVVCGRDGCNTRIFENYGSGTKTSPKSIQELAITNCVTERPRPTSGGSRSAPSDRSPSAGGYLGRGYIANSGRSPNNSCSSQQIVPLTNTLTTLNTAIEGLSPAGSTAGQVGIEMAWYMISPNFGSIDGVTPRAFNPAETVKAVVLMTDGEFNTAFCTGVIARTNVEGAGDNSYKINCDPTNGNGYEQSVAICNAMKAQGIMIYTVAFNLRSGRGGNGVDTAVEVMETCATDPDANFFEVGSGTDLKEAFKQIGRDITRLRIAR